MRRLSGEGRARQCAGRRRHPGMVGPSGPDQGHVRPFRAAGYDALAPDLYSGTVVPYHDTDAAGKEMSSLNFIEATDQTVRGAAQISEEQRREGRADRLLPGRRGDDHRRRPCAGAGGRRGAFMASAGDRRPSPADMKVPLQAHFANRTTGARRRRSTFEAG